MINIFKPAKVSLEGLLNSESFKSVLNDNLWNGISVVYLEEDGDLFMHKFINRKRNPSLRKSKNIIDKFTNFISNHCVDSDKVLISFTVGGTYYMPENGGTALSDISPSSMIYNEAISKKGYLNRSEDAIIEKHKDIEVFGLAADFSNFSRADFNSLLKTVGFDKTLLNDYQLKNTSMNTITNMHSEWVLEPFKDKSNLIEIFTNCKLTYDLNLSCVPMIIFDKNDIIVYNHEDFVIIDEVYYSNTDYIKFDVKLKENHTNKIIVSQYILMNMIFNSTLYLKRRGKFMIPISLKYTDGNESSIKFKIDDKVFIFYNMNKLSDVDFLEKNGLEYVLPSDLNDLPF